MPCTARGRTIIEQRRQGRLQSSAVTPAEREALREAFGDADSRGVIHETCRTAGCPCSGGCVGEDCYLLECEA